MFLHSLVKRSSDSWKKKKRAVVRWSAWELDCCTHENAAQNVCECWSMKSVGEETGQRQGKHKVADQVANELVDGLSVRGIF